MNKRGISSISALISVVLLISFLGWLSYKNYQIKQRDLQRIEDMKVLYLAIENYFASKGFLPIAEGEVCLTGEDSVSKVLLLSGELLSPLVDPLYPKQCYFYVPMKNGQSFDLKYYLEGNLNKKNKGEQHWVLIEKNI